MRSSRRGVVIGLVIAVCGLASSGVGASPGPGDEGNWLLNSGHNALVVGTHFAPPLQQAWRVELQGLVAAPVVANGRAFVIARNEGPQWLEMRLYALDVHTGAIAWGPYEFSPSPYPRAGIAADSTSVYLLYQGALVALDAATGQQRWLLSLTTSGTFDSPPTVASDRVFVTSESKLTAVDTTTGTIVWQQQAASDLASAAVANGRVFVGHVGGLAQGFEVSTGAPIWLHTSSISGGGGRTPIAVDDRVFVRDWADEEQHILDARSGAEVGTFRSGSPPVVVGSTLVGLQRFTTTLTAVDLDSSLTLWIANGAYVTPPVVVDDAVYVGAADGTVSAIDLDTGATLWSANSGGPIREIVEYSGGPMDGLGFGSNTLLVPNGTGLAAYVPAPPIDVPMFPGGAVGASFSTAALAAGWLYVRRRRSPES